MSVNPLLGPPDDPPAALVPRPAARPVLVAPDLEADLPDWPAGARPGRIDGPERDLLCALAYVYLACGQTGRALSLLRLVALDAPDDVGALRVLAYAHVLDEDGAEALAVVERLEALDPQPGSAAPHLLLRSHALRLLGRWDEARAAFARFVELRNEGSARWPTA